MENARPQTAETSALDKHHSNPVADLFPESLPPVVPVASPATGTRSNGALHTPLIVTGQCAEVLEYLRANQPVLSLDLTANRAIPETAARIHNLRGMGFNILTTILPEVEFRGRIRRNVALYSMGVPEWPRPGFLDGGAA